MSISYHAIVGHKRNVTLPSVESWGANMNILRDPPKSIQTRKIDKVGETSEITQMIQDAGNRMGDAILMYARGVNPMVAVSYDNYGNNGGQTVKQSSSGTQAFLPYRIMDGGAFRPPIQDQRSLYVLSRFPRVWTTSFTQPGFADYSKKAMCHGDDSNTKGVKNQGQTLKTSARPTVTYKVEKPISEPLNVRYVIKNPIQVEGFTMLNPIAKINADVGEVRNNVVSQPLKVLAKTNQSNTKMQVTSLSELYNTDPKVKEQFTISYTTPQRRSKNVEYIHDELELQRNIPQYQTRTNSGQNIHIQNEPAITEREYTLNRPMTSGRTNVDASFQNFEENFDRNYSLKPSITKNINMEGYNPNVYVPKVTSENTVPEFDQNKSRMRQKIYDMQMERNTIGNPNFA